METFAVGATRKMTSARGGCEARPGKGEADSGQESACTAIEGGGRRGHEEKAGIARSFYRHRRVVGGGRTQVGVK